MSNFLSTGVSGLMAFQRALDVTSHNIANVGTDGYSRQRAEFTTRPAHPYGNGWLGSGVEVSTVRRMYDDLLSSQVRGTASSLAGFDAFARQMERVNNLFSSTTTGLSASLTKFANALQDVANSPASIPARQVLLSEANVLTNRLKSYDSTLAGFDREIDARLAGEATDISTLAQGIANLNQKIALESTRTGDPPNDLLDERDRLLDQLATHIDVTTVQDGYKTNVFVGSGQPLVLGDLASKLSLVADPYDPTRHEIALSTTGGGSLNISKNITGGTLGGLMDFRTQVLDPTRNTIGRMSVALTDVVNEQHRAGIDLNGQLGGDLFRVGGVQVLTHNGNEGAATVSVTRGDIEDLTESDYTLSYTSSGWEMRDAASGAVIPLAGDGSSTTPFEGAGLSIVIGGGTPEEGDRYLIRPTLGAASGLGVNVTDPAKIAAASPIRTAADAANSGGVQISAGQVLDPTNTDLTDLVEIEFISDTQYTINGGTAQNYVSGQAIEMNGWSVTLTGTPAAGDTFTVSQNASGSGDNRNALALADALRRPVLDGGTASLDATATRLVGSIGVATTQAQSNRDAQSVISTELASARDSVSGVNLDEEAANLLRYQQAYQAAAQLIRVASSLFDTLINAVGR